MESFTHTASAAGASKPPPQDAAAAAAAAATPPGKPTAEPRGTFKKNRGSVAERKTPRPIGGVKSSVCDPCSRPAEGRARRSAGSAKGGSHGGATAGAALESVTFGSPAAVRASRRAFAAACATTAPLSAAGYTCALGSSTVARSPELRLPKSAVAGRYSGPAQLAGRRPQLRQRAGCDSLQAARVVETPAWAESAEGLTGKAADAACGTARRDGIKQEDCGGLNANARDGAIAAAIVFSHPADVCQIRPAAKRFKTADGAGRPARFREPVGPDDGEGGNFASADGPTRSQRRPGGPDGTGGDARVSRGTCRPGGGGAWTAYRHWAFAHQVRGGTKDALASGRYLGLPHRQ